MIAVAGGIALFVIGAALFSVFVRFLFSPAGLVLIAGIVGVGLINGWF